MDPSDTPVFAPAEAQLPCRRDAGVLGAGVSPGGRRSPLAPLSSRRRDSGRWDARTPGSRLDAVWARWEVNVWPQQVLLFFLSPFPVRWSLGSEISSAGT